MTKILKVAKGYSIPYGNNNKYSISHKEHQENLRNLRRLPQVLKEIPALDRGFAEKPRFIITQKGKQVTVIRKDYQNGLRDLISSFEENFSRKLSLSEWRLMTLYRGQNPEGLPITMHDVYVEYDFKSGQKITIKTGNPFRNNAWLEFYRALYARYLGIVEAKSPIGFSFWSDDLYGIEKPGRMFYKHLEGIDIITALQKESQDMLNWALWEAGKFFSRLIKARLFLEDSHRIRNFFIEESPATIVFRFLDLEYMRYLPVYGREKQQEMLTKFIQEALKIGFLDEDRLGEFKLVCLGKDIPLETRFDKIHKN